MSKLKIECARRQLGTALNLYLRNLDPGSVHCLANGRCELVQQAGGLLSPMCLASLVSPKAG